jgi:hypothetical protein
MSDADRITEHLIDALSTYIFQHDCGLSAFKGQPKPKDGKCPCPLCRDAREAIAQAIQAQASNAASVELESTA